MATNEIPKVIVTGYYDGPTEGIIRVDEKNEQFFFKLVAWDDQQDKRMFALKKMGTKVYREIVNLLKESLESSRASSTWGPIWSFPSEQQRIQADKLLEEYRHKSSVDLLVLGESIDGKVKAIIPKVDFSKEVIALITKDQIDSVEKWLKLFVNVQESEL